MNDIQISAHTARGWNREPSQADLSTASEADPRYETMLGDVEIRTDKVDLSARWGWVPLIDFTVGLVSLLRQLPQTKQATFDFTESGAELRFYLLDGIVEMRTNYADGIIRIDYDRLLAAACSFAASTFDTLTTEAPSLRKNPTFRRLVEETQCV